MNISRSLSLDFRLWSRWLWSNKANGRDVLGPLLRSDHPVDYCGLWGPWRLLQGLLLGGPRCLLDLLVDGLLLVIVPLPGGGCQGEDRRLTRSTVWLMATVLPSPTHHHPTGPPLVKVAQSGKERIRDGRCQQQEEELTWQGGAQRGCRAWRRWPPSGSAATPSSTGRYCSGWRPSSTHLMPRPYLSKIVLSTLTHFTFLGPYFHCSTMNCMLEFAMALTGKFSNDIQFLHQFIVSQWSWHCKRTYLLRFIWARVLSSSCSPEGWVATGAECSRETFSRTGPTHRGPQTLDQ